MIDNGFEVKGIEEIQETETKVDGDFRLQSSLIIKNIRVGALVFFVGWLRFVSRI